MAPEFDSRPSRSTWSVPTPTPYRSGFVSLCFPLTHAADCCYTFNAQACPTWGPSRGLLPLSGMFFSQKPLWLTTLPLINLCSNVTFQRSLLWLPYLELQPAPPSPGMWDLPHTLFCFAFFCSTYLHTFHVTFTFMLISWFSRSLYRNLELSSRFAPTLEKGEKASPPAYSAQKVSAKEEGRCVKLRIPIFQRDGFSAFSEQAFWL